MSRDEGRAAALVALLAFALTMDAGAAARAQPVPPPPLADTVACLRRAARETDLLAIQMRRLCYGAPSPDAPVDCYLIARDEFLLTDPQAIELCRCSDSLAPATCYDGLRHGISRTEPERIAMCSPTILRNLRFDCRPRS